MTCLNRTSRHPEFRLAYRSHFFVASQLQVPPPLEIVPLIRPAARRPVQYWVATDILRVKVMLLALIWSPVIVPMSYHDVAAKLPLMCPGDVSDRSNSPSQRLSGQSAIQRQRPATETTDGRSERPLSAGCWPFERDFVWVCVSGAASPPDTDLSVFPIVPPVDPACPKASELHARNIRMARRGLAAAPLICGPTIVTHTQCAQRRHRRNSHRL